MATATITTRIANPAHRRKRRRNLSAKQVRFFGTKRQRAALKANRSRNTTHHRKNSARHHRKRTRKSNPGEILALINPATKRRRNKMAATKRRSRRNAAGRHHRRHHRKNPSTVRVYNRRRRNVHHRVHHRKRNPGTYGRPMDWLSLGLGALAGGVGATTLPQMILGTSNTGPIGYLANAAATGILAVIGHMAFKRNASLVAGIIAGGAGAIIKRVIGDYSLLGQYGAALGLGDYLASDFLTPQSMVNGLQTAQLSQPSWAQAPTTVVNVAGAGAGMGALVGGRLY
jgi:hypothetical protein